MNFNFFNIFIIAGSIQGLIFTTVVIFSKKFRSRSTLFLTVLILVYSVSNVMYILPDIGLISLEDMYRYIYLPFAALIPVLIYCYVVFFLNPLKRIRLSDKLLFLPFLILFLLTLFFRIGFILNYDDIPIFKYFRILIITTEIFSVVLAVILLIILIRKVIVYEKKHSSFKIEIIKSNLFWLKSILLIIFLFTLFWGYLTYRNVFVASVENAYYVLWASMATIIYFFGHVGIYRFGLLKERQKIRNYIRKQKSLSKSKSKNEHIIAFEKLLVDSKLFLDCNLSLEKVAKNLNLSNSYLSRMIKKELQTNFTEYLNNLRINEAISYLSNSDFSNYSITSIGLEAGFNSKSSFYEVFKKKTGKTPLSYKNEILNNVD